MLENCGAATDEIEETRLSKALVISSNGALYFQETPKAARHQGTAVNKLLAVTTANTLKLT